MSAVQVDGYLGAAKLLHATVNVFVSSASRLKVTEPGANLTFGAMYYGPGSPSLLTCSAEPPRRRSGSPPLHTGEEPGAGRRTAGRQARA